MGDMSYSSKYFVVLACIAFGRPVDLLRVKHNTIGTMSNHMYGSPFPVINPKIRYKTVLERAGFDVNYKGKIPDDNKLASTSGNESSVMSNDSHNKGFYQANNVRSYENMSNRSARSNTNYISGSQDKLTHGTNSNSSHIQQKDMAFNFERNSGQTSPVNSVENGLTPIEKSFMMLTENDTTTSFHSAEDFNKSGAILNENTQHSLIQQRHVDPPGDVSSMSVSTLASIPVSASALSPVIAPVITSVLPLNQQQNKYMGQGLNTNLTMSQEQQRQNPYVRQSQPPQQNPYVAQVRNPNMPQEPQYPQPYSLSHPYSQAQALIGNGMRAPPFVTSPNIITCTDDQRDSNRDSLNLSVNPQLEVNLLPEVNHRQETFRRIGLNEDIVDIETVSSKNTRCLHSWEQRDLFPNSQISEPISILSEGDVSTPMTSTNFQVENLIAQLDDMSMSRNNDLDKNNQFNSFLSVKDTRFKKSSAYLSGYPMMKHLKNFEAEGNELNNNPKITAQSIAMPDNNESVSSFNTPQFLNFGKQEPLTATTLDSHEEFPKHSSEEEPVKQKPGKGPCRKCNLEITHKPIFSKNNNELSGQWHRACFQCTRCDIKFNKITPCYILADQPYCQQHFHEENNSICKTCNKFIEGECLENDKRERFHVACLLCFLCKAPTSDEYFIFNGEVPICGNHDVDALLRDGLTRENTQTTQYQDNNTLSKRRTRLINFA